MQQQHIVAKPLTVLLHAPRDERAAPFYFSLTTFAYIGVVPFGFPYREAA